MTAPGTPCPHRPCKGTIRVSGYCGTCRRHPSTAPTREEAGPAALPGPRAARCDDDAPAGTPRAAATPGALDRDGLVQLPSIPPPADADVVRAASRRPEGGRRCGVQDCTGTIGLSYDDGPAPDEGFCPKCGTRYSFLPQLGPGDVVAGQYRVIGYLSPGGTGWVYLAEDLDLPGQRVVLKAQINTQDAAARRKAVEERRSLTTLHHRDIVGIIASKQHRREGESEPTDYIVMEYVAGRPLDQLLRSSDEELTELFGEPFALDHVVTYGCKILGALEYLHDQGLLYCDMKPENVIHYDRQIKVIDLGAVRRIDDHDSALVHTPRFAPKKRERDERGFLVDSDLFTVGRTLAALATRAKVPAGLAARSFDRLIGRATHDDPAARFTSAVQMSRQLWEVLREHRALDRGERYPERSTRFEPTAVTFGAALGAAPALTHWTLRPEGVAPPDLATGVPTPQETVRALPGPVADPEDPAAVLLGGLAGHAPERTAERVEDDPALRTVEVALWLCRSYLLSGESGPAGDPARAAAEKWLGEAVRLMGPDVAGYDWRPPWHRGLLLLARGRVKDAQGEFAAVYATVPGEWAPKLALGYCAEYLRGTLAAPRPAGDEAPAVQAAAAEEARTRAREAEAEAEAYYRAGWARDRAHTSAAFGLARLRLLHGDRADAVRILDQVPTTSRTYDLARIAALRILTGRVTGTAPSQADLREAGERLAELPRDGARDRLVAEIRENVLAGHPAPGRPVPWRSRLALAVGRGTVTTDAEPDFPRLPPGELFDGAASREALAGLLYGSLRTLVGQAREAQRAELLDRAYAVRPQSRF
ncbi:tetratricopeptide repeat protein [Actinacidiphila paucisporea]|uniref:non-specific serine/threonine protein kinase n=1 Tax=Actinacidiphila paucisporea TaxID=310782 RepID=A0A1M6XGG2_9ACTN|nr:tetratricopeptide repeat protein [Actinacidiphila paucisporea]SHL04993.1 serine/threonine protein kinase [Actinacidiphila paucisporea]